MSYFASKTPNEKSSHDPHLNNRNSIKPGAGAGVFKEHSHRPDFADTTIRKKGHKKGRGAYLEYPHRPAFAGPVVQKQMKVGSSNDPLEKEADAVADKVMRMPAGDTVRRQEAVPEEEELPISRKEKSGGEAAIAPGTQAKIESSQGGGQALPASERDFFEPRFGKDFSDVRLHTDSKAAEAAQDINARAFTIGNDVFFNAGEYKPGTGDGRFLMAHELTHTLQTNGGKGVQRDVIQRQKGGAESKLSNDDEEKIVQHGIHLINTDFDDWSPDDKINPKVPPSKANKKIPDGAHYYKTKKGKFLGFSPRGKLGNTNWKVCIDIVIESWQKGGVRIPYMARKWRSVSTMVKWAIKSKEIKTFVFYKRNDKTGEPRKNFVYRRGDFISNFKDSHSGLVVQGGTIEKAVILHSPGGSMDSVDKSRSWKTGLIRAKLYNKVYGIRVVGRPKKVKRRHKK